MEREAVTEVGLRVVKRLRAEGFSAYWVGGCVRDKLLGRPIKDIDIATDAAPSDVARLFRKTIPVGAKFGVVVVLLGGYQFQVARFRADVSYSDGRHPDAVKFADVQEDVKRRDFTINGMLFDPLKDELLDFVGGQDDIRKKLIRAIGEPKERMEEDRLRMLRAVRFAVMLDFEIEQKTWNAIKEMADGITVISGERIREELAKIVEADRMERAAELLDESGLLDSVLPEFAELADAPFREGVSMRKHSLSVFASLSAPTFVEAMAALIHNCKGSAEESKKRVLSVSERLRLSGEERSRLMFLVTNQNALDGAKRRSLAYLKRLFARNEYPELFRLYVAKSKAGCGETESVVFVEELRRSLSREEIAPEPFLSGDDLIEAGYSPSPLFGKVLDTVYDAQLEGKVKDKEEALRMAEELFSESGCEGGSGSA